MIDLRPRHNLVRDYVMARAMPVTIAHAILFTAVLLSTPANALASVFLWFLLVPVMIMFVVHATIRPMVARENGLEVEGELVPWSCVSEPKIALISNGERAWITVQGTGWKSDLMILAKPKEIQTIARMRTTTPPEQHHSAYRGLVP